MSEAQALLARISSLRQRLEKSRGQARQTIEATSALGQDWPGPARPTPPDPVRLNADSQHDLQMDRIVEEVTGPVLEAPPRRPVQQLTARARRVLERGQEMVSRIRSLADFFAPLHQDAENPLAVNPLQIDYADPIARVYREAAASVDTTLRMIPLFPDGALGQLHLCEGLESILGLVNDRLGIVEAASRKHQEETGLVSELAQILTSLVEGQCHDRQPVFELAEKLLTESREGEPLRFLSCDPTHPARFVASHCLTTARVMARVVRHDVELRSRCTDAVVASLLHDVGMLKLPPEIFALPHALDEAQRQALPDHCRQGAELLAPLGQDLPWLAEAAHNHHERCDGSGYPQGLQQNQVSSLTRLLAVCDTYASLCSPRPYRPARDTRTALADTLLLADQGYLDRGHAEHLLQLSFYPIGSAVEMADGSIGVVVALPRLKHILAAPARPVVALLLDSDGQPLPRPRHVDLAQMDQQSIVRTLSVRERRDLLGPTHPEWVAA